MPIIDLPVVASGTVAALSSLESACDKPAQFTAVTFVCFEEKSHAFSTSVSYAVDLVSIALTTIVIVNDQVRKTQEIFIFVKHSLEVANESLFAGGTITEMRKSLGNVKGAEFWVEI